MANFFPLIINPTGNSIQELPAADFLDLSQSGIANSGNITVSGVISATGNIIGGNLIGNGRALTSLNATNINTGTLTQARLANAAVTLGSTALTLGSTVTTVAGLSSVTSTTFVGALTGAATTAATVTTAAQPNITSVGTLSSLAVTGNTSSGNFVGTLNGSGANVTLLNASNISSGTLDQARLANASLTVNGTSIALGGSGTITATATNALTIGTGLGGTSYNGSTGVTITNTGVTSIVAGTNIAVSGATGAVTVSVTGTVASATTAGTVTTAAQPNITSVGTMSAATITTLTTAGITKSGTNGVGNIGAAASTFNTVFAKATSAQYADVAERYQADADYAPGTVLIIGGAQEVTASTLSHDHRAAGVVSENPSYLMNSSLDTVNSVAVALLGRVPCQVVGPIDRGDLLATSTVPGTAGRLDPAKYLPGCVIGKALQDYHSEQLGTIEIAVGVK